MTSARSVQQPPRGGALLRPDRTRAIWRAAIIELARVGYDQLSMDSVAKRAGVGKAALYRRWPSKEAMVIALISEIEIEIVVAADLGSLQADVRDYLSKAFKLLRRPLAARILPDLYAETSRDTALAAAIRIHVQQRKRESVQMLLARAVSRGELSFTPDYELAFDLLVGPIYWRALITKSPTSGTDLEQLAAATTAALKAWAPPVPAQNQNLK
ncbi:TetR/AcrR family transcriptional regulator [Deinococcus sp. Arct2-2]|uniref:TetR/AcrR family transcriptional regulator n=1 Tax=Deinococcus sp. Arct2-2 TaxID=2568653 RepID=UPI001454CAC0|nr:TetR/AcrR family transcriptional regulator [Deinococcus sp. Arct2-2]